MARGILIFSENVIIERDEAVIRSQIDRFMQENHYNRVESQTDLVFKRGLKIGSSFAFRARDFQVTVTIQIKTKDRYQSQVGIDFNVDTTGQMVLNKTRKYWANELSNLVTYLGGIRQPGAAEAIIQLENDFQIEKRIHSGANWFFWIAGLSLVNTIMFLIDGDIYFILGLGITQLIDIVAKAVMEELPSMSNLIITMMQFVLDGFCALIFVLLGYFGRKREKWAFWVGLVLYGLDGLIFLWAMDIKSLIFHVIGLVGILRGLKAVNQFAKLDPSQAKQPNPDWKSTIQDL